MKIDCHIHTEYSHDCWTPVPDILDAAVAQGLDAVAITDHDTVEGVPEARTLVNNRDISVIPGVERTVPMGKHGLHLLVLGINQLPPNDDPQTVIESVHKLGGTVILPHPFRNGTGLFYHRDEGNLDAETVDWIADSIDYVEALNWKDSKPDIRSTLAFANNAGCPVVSGSDAHAADDVGQISTRLGTINPFDRNPEIVAELDGSVPATVHKVPEKLLGHTTRANSSKSREQFLVTGATVLKTLPSDKPKQLAKRALRRGRALYSNHVSKQFAGSNTKKVVISHKEEKGLNLDSQK